MVTSSLLVTSSPSPPVPAPWFLKLRIVLSGPLPSSVTWLTSSESVDVKSKRPSPSSITSPALALIKAAWARFGAAPSPASTVVTLTGGAAGAFVEETVSTDVGSAQPRNQQRGTAKRKWTEWGLCAQLGSYSNGMGMHKFRRHPTRRDARAKDGHCCLILSLLMTNYNAFPRNGGPESQRYRMPERGFLIVVTREL